MGFAYFIDVEGPVYYYFIHEIFKSLSTGEVIFDILNQTPRKCGITPFVRGRLKTVITDIYQHKVIIGYVDENLVTHLCDVSSVDIAVDPW